MWNGSVLPSAPTVQDKTERDRVGLDMTKKWTQQCITDSSVSTVEQCCAVWCQISQTTAALGSTAVYCGAEVDGDGDNDCTFTAMTLYAGTLQGRLHVCISRVGGSTVCIYASSLYTDSIYNDKEDFTTVYYIIYFWLWFIILCSIGPILETEI